MKIILLIIILIAVGIWFGVGGRELIKNRMFGQLPGNMLLAYKVKQALIALYLARFRGDNAGLSSSPGKRHVSR